MAVFRVERNKGYTVMSNHHLRNKELAVVISAILILCMKEREATQTKKKAKKVAPKKGW